MRNAERNEENEGEKAGGYTYTETEETSRTAEDAATIIEVVRLPLYR